MADEQWVTIPDWAEKQHYKSGRGTVPWIKLHRKILDSKKFQCLPLASKALAPMLWLLAAENGGRVDVNPENLAWRLRWPADEITAGLKGLFSKDYLEGSSPPLAECYQDAREEEEEDKEEDKEKKKKGAKRASRLSKDFELPEDWKEYAINGGLSLADIERQFQDMIDWSISAPNGKKLDWRATWQTWCRRHKAWGEKIKISNKILDIKMPKDPLEAKKASELLERIGRDKYASYFGTTPPKLVDDIWVIDPSGSSAKADIINNRFGGSLDDIYGQGHWQCFAGVGS